jgi:hypothetical protein
MDSAAVVATAGASLALSGMIVYVRDVRRGPTVPHRGSWLVWSVIAVIATVSQGSRGISWGTLVLGVQAAATVAVFALALRRGVGGVSVGNAVLIGVAGIGLLAWITLSEPLPATLGAAVADGAGLVAIVPKIWTRPSSETTATYALAGATGLTAAMSAPSLDVGTLLFPCYFCLANTAIALLIVYRRRSAVGDDRPLVVERVPALAR